MGNKSSKVVVKPSNVVEPSKVVVNPQTVENTEPIKYEPIVINFELINKIEKIKETKDIEYLNRIYQSFLIELDKNMEDIEQINVPELRKDLKILVGIKDKIIECYIFFKDKDVKRKTTRMNSAIQVLKKKSNEKEDDNNNKDADEFINNFSKETIDDLTDTFDKDTTEFKIKIKNKDDLNNFENKLNENINKTIENIKENKNIDYVNKNKLLIPMIKIVNRLQEKYRELNVELPKEYIESGILPEEYIESVKKIQEKQPNNNNNTVEQPKLPPEESVNNYSKYLNDKYIKPLYDENIKNIGGKRKTRRNKKKSKKSHKNKNKKTTRRK